MTSTIGAALRGFAILSFFFFAAGCDTVNVARVPTETDAACHSARLGPRSPVAAAVAGSVVELHVRQQHPTMRGNEELVGLGYGTVIDDAGDVLAPRHVVRDATGIRAFPVEYDDGTVRAKGDAVEMVVRRTCRDCDAVLLSPAGRALGLPALPVVHDLPEWNDAAYVLCGTQGWQSGHVTNPYVTQPANGPLIEVNIATRPGDSGSPLVNGCGQLVGFVVLGSPDNPHSYYVPASLALKSLENGS